MVVMEHKYYKIYIIIIICHTSFDLLLFHELFFLFRFHPSKVATKVVTLFIRQQSGHPWPTWGAIPKDCEELYFQHFKVTYPSVNELVQWLKWIVMLILFYLI